MPLELSPRARNLRRELEPAPQVRGAKTCLPRLSLGRGDGIRHALALRSGVARCEDMDTCPVNRASPELKKAPSHSASPFRIGYIVPVETGLKAVDNPAAHTLAPGTHGQIHPLLRLPELRRGV